MPRATKPKVEPLEDNMVVLKFAYDAEYVLPYDDAMRVVESFKKAEKFEDKYEEGKFIKPVAYRDLGFHLLAKSEYLQIKVNNLLGVKHE